MRIRSEFYDRSGRTSEEQRERLLREGTGGSAETVPRRRATLSLQCRLMVWDAPQRLWQKLKKDWALWHHLRGVGNSGLVRLTVLTPVLGYLILLNETVSNYLQLHPRLALFSSDVPVRLLFLYYGTVVLAVASLTYIFRCPQIVKRYGSASEYCAAELNYQSSANHLKLLRDRVRTLVEKDYIRELLDNFDQMQLHVKTANLKSSADSEIQEVMTLEWQLNNLDGPVSRSVCLLLFYLGFSILSVPAIMTFAEVTIRLLPG